MITAEVLSEEDLILNLNEFRDTLINYDFSEVKNVVFLNVASLNTYIKNNKNNPFTRQYREIETLFNKIMPYIPSNIPNEAVEAITKILETKYDDKSVIKKNIYLNVKMDFIRTVKNIHSEKQWSQLLTMCKRIRNAKTQ